MTAKLRLERLAQKTGCFEAIPPRTVCGLGDTDARSDGDLHLRAPRMDRKRRFVECKPVLSRADAERLANPPRAGAQKPLVLEAPAAPHGRNSVRRQQCANEYGACRAFRLA